MSISPTDSKGQTSMEFLVMVVFMTVIFASAYSIIGSEELELAERQVGLQGAAVADKIGYELDMALSQGEGFKRTFTVPQEIGNADYNITLVNGTIQVKWRRSSVFSSTAATDVRGNLTPGSNRIANRGGFIEVVE